MYVKVLNKKLCHANIFGVSVPNTNKFPCKSNTRHKHSEKVFITKTFHIKKLLTSLGLKCFICWPLRPQINQKNLHVFNYFLALH